MSFPGFPFKHTFSRDSKIELTLQDLSGPRETKISVTCDRCQVQAILFSGIAAPGDGVPLELPAGWEVRPSGPAINLDGTPGVAFCPVCLEKAHDLATRMAFYEMKAAVPFQKDDDERSSASSPESRENTRAPARSTTPRGETQAPRACQAASAAENKATKGKTP